MLQPNESDKPFQKKTLCFVYNLVLLHSVIKRVNWM